MPARCRPAGRTASSGCANRSLAGQNVGVTRGPIPRFDLYEELEVSRSASAEVIDAAYRVLVKHYHPDVASGAGANGKNGNGSGGNGAHGVDAERIKRLNVAHDWLSSPTRRRQVSMKRR